jgi:N-acetylmuramoyl-L-alanine amidase
MKRLIVLTFLFLFCAGSFGISSGQTSAAKIVLDPGHGGTDPGTIAKSGLTEKAVNWDITLKLKEELQRRGYEVVLTREKDINMGLPQRVDFANRSGADLFVSIHANSFPLSYIRGSLVLYYDDRYPQKNYPPSLQMKALSPQSRMLAEIVLDSIVKEAGTVNRGLMPSAAYVIRMGMMPSILVETAFLSNPYDAAFLAEEHNRWKLARGIAAGIEKFRPAAYRDVSGHWALYSIINLKDMGLMSGYNSRFYPDRPLTRAEFFAIVDRLLDSPLAGSQAAFSGAQASPPEGTETGVDLSAGTEAQANSSNTGAEAHANASNSGSQTETHAAASSTNGQTETHVTSDSAVQSGSSQTDAHINPVLSAANASASSQTEEPAEKPITGQTEVTIAEPADGQLSVSVDTTSPAKAESEAAASKPATDPAVSAEPKETDADPVKAQPGARVSSGPATQPDSRGKSEGSDTEALSVPNPVPVSFRDLSESHWAYSSLVKAVSRGYLLGYPDGTIRPNQPITRAEVSVIFDRIFYGSVGGAAETVSPMIDMRSPLYIDVPVEMWASEAIYRLREKSLLRGVDDQRFAPRQSMSRAEVAVMIDRFLKQSPSL